MDIRKHINNANLKWNNLPKDYFEAPYVGNGTIGTIFWLNNENEILFEMGRSDFYDHRSNNLSLLYKENRLKTGAFFLKIDDSELDGDMELDLYKATAAGTIKTKKSMTKVKTFTCDDRDIIVIEVEAVSGPCDFVIDYRPYTCQSPRLEFFPLEGYNAYPPAEICTEENVNLCIQSLPEDEKYDTAGKGEGQFATAWIVEKENNITRLYISMKYSYPGTSAANDAKQEVICAQSIGLKSLYESHLDFWKNLYETSSFISIPDERIEKYYYLQHYRFASATRPNGIVLDLQGPWLTSTTWPAIWWNMNEQITYSHIGFANHPEYIEPVLDLLFDNRKMMENNCELGIEDVYCLDRASSLTLNEKSGEKHEYGNLAYMLYYLWEMYRLTMDDKLLKDKLLPLMKGALRFLLAKSVTGTDGKIHFVSSASPEFTEGVEDCSYTISAAKWLAKTILKSYERLGINDDFAETCHNFLSNVIDYLIDPKTGFMIGKDLPLNCFHTHWSHMFMLYPYKEIGFDFGDMTDIANKSFDNWIARQEQKFFAGFCSAGAASMYAHKGDGDGALRRFDYYINNKDFYFNGMFTDTIHKGKFAPVFETPIGMIRALQEMLLLYKNDAIFICNAIPSCWNKLEYEKMRTEGAFLVSAKYENGKITYAEIQSLMGEECIVGYENLSHLNCSADIAPLCDGKAKINIAKGEKVIFS